MTQFTGLRPILWTENLDDTIGFYMRVLGFTLMGRNDDWQWASLRKDEIYIMLSQPNEHEKTAGMALADHFILMSIKWMNFGKTLKQRPESAMKLKLLNGE
ncbi:bleomycin resistance family protein [Chryseobacterium arthrosphaerae]|uniref:VOC family protein n=1 Tax=Chryseobacterium arthrosphaerae TaxID=651561 RepID=UPI0023E1086C|nr:VOC family protein [Chryseobacterium arthrosphaerae]WES99463.1 bleomycin resistance family protein [Chryseobacterium arthrosphaerae]